MCKNKKNYISALSIICCIGVVYLHVNFVFWEFSDQRYWVEANAIESLFYFAVPCFFMISGATLMDYRERYSTREYFIKRIRKTGIPFLFWSIAVLIWKYSSGGYGENAGIRDLLTRFVSGDIGVPYWFFLALFGVYLVIPVLSEIPKKKRIQTFQYMIGVMFIIQSLLPLIHRFLGIGPVSGNLLSPAGGNYLMYVVLGWYLDHKPLPKKIRWIVYVLALLSLILILSGTMFLSFRDGMINDLFKGYFNVPAALYASGVFLFFRTHDWGWMKSIMWISKFTMSIYLLHQIVLTLLLQYLPLNPYSLWFRLLAPVFLIIPLCIVITWIIRFLPLGKRILPE